jgi:hypothetical protein
MNGFNSPPSIQREPQLLIGLINQTNFPRMGTSTLEAVKAGKTHHQRECRSERHGVLSSSSAVLPTCSGKASMRSS